MAEPTPKPPAEAKPGAPKKSGAKPDLVTIGGLVLSLGGILGGLILEGGKIQDVAQVTAAIIVFGGTIGAVMVTTPMGTLVRAVKNLKLVFFEQSQTAHVIIDVNGYFE